MKAHELAKALLAAPNVPVVINGWGSDEGFTFEVSEVSPLGTCTFSGVEDTLDTPRDAMGWQNPRECVSLFHGRHTPSPIIADVERTSVCNVRKASLTNAVVYGITPAQFQEWADETARQVREALLK